MGALENAMIIQVLNTLRAGLQLKTEFSWSQPMFKTDAFEFWTSQANLMKKSELPDSLINLLNQILDVCIKKTLN